jgi:LPXTG-motif cell wall-anchored protein
MKSLLKVAVAVAVVAGLLAPLAAMAQTQKVAEERSGVILKLSGTTVIVRNDKQEIRKFTGIPEGMTVYVDGKPIKFRDLREGMTYKAVRFENVPAPVTVTMSEVEAMPSNPGQVATAPAPAPEPVAAPAPAPAEPAKVLPKTGSALPTMAWIGFGLLGAGLALGVRRQG